MDVCTAQAKMLMGCQLSRQHATALEIEKKKRFRIKQSITTGNLLRVGTVRQGSPKGKRQSCENACI